jgi:iron complex outermembrane receptor protein
MKTSLVASTAIFWMIGALSAAYAQSAAVTSATPGADSKTSSNAAAGEGGATSLGEIVVTAEKRAESIQKVPISIAAVTGKTIEEQNIKFVQDLASVTSGLDYFTSSTGVIPFIRGIGNNSAALGNEPPVTTYVDGVYLPSPSSSVFALDNVDRIEVLKGPQGTLFGRNALGGAINVITRTPQQTPSFDVTAGYANYNTFSGSFYGTAGLAKNLAADLALSGFDQTEGWGHNLYNGSAAYLNNNFDARTKLLWTPTTTTTVTLEADYDRTREDAGTTLSAIPGAQKAPYTNFPLGGFYDTDDVVNQYRTAEQGGGSLHIEQDLPWAVITSITGGRALRVQADEDATVLPIPYDTYVFYESESSYTEELNIQSTKDSKIKWIAGVFYFEDTNSFDPFYIQGTSSGQGANGQSILYSAQRTISYSGYGQVTAPLWTDKAHITLGLRYTDDEHRLTEANSLLLTSAGAYTTPVPIVNATPSLNQGAFTYKAALDYSFTPSTMVYASYNRGFKSGFFNITSGGGAATPPTKAEFIDAYDVGFKSQFLDNRLLLDVDGFYYNVSDLQVKFTSPTLGLPIFGNAASAIDKGFDATFEARLTPQLQLTANVTYADYTYQSYNNVTFFNYVNGVQGSGYLASAAGKEVIFAEPWSGNVGARYHVNSSMGEWTANANLSFHAKAYFDAQNILARDAYQIFNASLGWRSLDHTWGVDLWGRNLNGAKYYIGESYAAYSGDYSPGQPRMFGVTLHYHY